MADISKGVAKALTCPTTWARAPSSVRAQAHDHIDDAVKQVMGAPDRAARAAMLSRLPPHIAGIVRDRVAALWGGARVIFATDSGPDGRRDAIMAADDRGGTVHVLELEDLCIVTIKNPA